MKFLVLIGTMLGVLAFAGRVGADLAISGRRNVDSYAIVTSAAYDDYCEHAYEIRRGDTLESIAEALWKDRARVKDLEKANPGVDPRKLAIGKTLVVPAKSAEPADAKAPLAFDFYAWSAETPPDTLEKIRLGQRLYVPRYAFAIVAVPIAHRAEFEKFLAEKHGSIGAELRALKWVKISKVYAGRRDVSSDSKAKSAVSTYEVSGIDPKVDRDPENPTAPRVTLETVEKRVEFIDADGKPAAAGFETPTVILGVMCALMGAVALFLRRRARAVRAA